MKKYTATGEPLNKLPAKEEGKVDGLAVDATGNVWLYRAVEESGEIEGFSTIVTRQCCGIGSGSGGGAPPAARHGGPGRRAARGALRAGTEDRKK